MTLLNTTGVASESGDAYFSWVSDLIFGVLLDVSVFYYTVCIVSFSSMTGLYSRLRVCFCNIILFTYYIPPLLFYAVGCR